MNSLNAEAKALLEKAAELIGDPEHWYKGAFHSFDNKAHCLAGAINHFYTTKPEVRSRAIQALFAVIPSCPNLTPHNCNRMINFNDRSDTTHEDVMLVLKRAIYILEEDE